MNYRYATSSDSLLLAELNHQLIQDERHRNPMTVQELADRMDGWLAGEYRAVLFEHRGESVAYALFKENDGEIYCRQFFVVRNRRRQGLGRAALSMLRSRIWSKRKRLVVEVLAQNVAAVSFWRSLGFRDYSLALEVMPESETLTTPAGEGQPN
jgi:GNAT superfamily N-acetyltransferase